MRGGAEYFLQPSQPAKRRYEALRFDFVEEASAAAIRERFGYVPATMHHLAAEPRDGRAEFFRSSKPQGDSRSEDRGQRGADDGRERST